MIHDGSQVISKNMKERSMVNSLEESFEMNCGTFCVEEFSFNHKTSTHHIIALKEKYFDIYNHLKSINKYDLLDLLLQELHQNETYKQELISTQNRIRVVEEQNLSLTNSLNTKEQAIQLLCESEENNIRIVEKLQRHIEKQGESGRENRFEKKYRELSKYMDEYIMSMNEAQNEFKRTYACLKDENNRMHNQISNLNQENTQIKQQIQELKQMFQTSETNFLQFSHNVKISDRLESRISFDQEPSNDFDFIGENGKEGMMKIELGSIKKEDTDENRKSFLEKIRMLNKEIDWLKENNGLLEKQVISLERENKKILHQYEELDDALLLQKTEKEIIRRQFLIISEKFRLVEPIHSKEVQQSKAKIHNELFELEECKEKKEDSSKEISCQVLGEISMNECFFSNSIYSNSMKHSFQKKGKEDMSLKLYEKENIRNIQEEDSLVE